MNWMLMPLRKYAQFSGRSQRKEFWMFALLIVIVSIIASIIDHALGFGRASVINTADVKAAMWQSYGPVQGLVLLATFLPNLAVSVRRLHDIDRTGWWLLAFLIPYALGVGLAAGAAFSMIGSNGNPTAFQAGGGALGLIALGGLLTLVGMILGIVLLVFYCLDGTKGPNRFGPDPKSSIPDLADRFS